MAEQTTTKRDPWDALAALGYLMVCGGAWWVYRPLGIVALGIGIITVGVLGALRE